VAEGVFDALSLTLAGCPRAVAIFGVSGWRWDWVKDVAQIVFAFDGDQVGQQTLRKMAIEGALRGKSIGTLNPKTLGQHKDLNEAWCAGNLQILDPPTSSPGGAGRLEGGVSISISPAAPAPLAL
jgi:hypothetical protein